MSDAEFDNDEEYDSELELQAAFQAGLLKPGLNTISTVEKKQATNNVAALKSSRQDLFLDLRWVERLDVVTGQAPLAPELAMKLEETQNLRQNVLKNSKNSGSIEEDPVLNDFKREMMFHRQAQAAVLESFPRLKSLGVLTKRPDDYFAQMAKSDEHMQKVRENLMRKKHATERSEKVRQVRQMKKIHKQVQAQSRLKRESEKKKMLDEVKKFRHKVRDNLDFLDEKKPQQQQKKLGPGFANNRAQAKRNYKDKKFGYGGKKRGTKSNTKASAADMTEYRRPNKGKGIRPGKSNKSGKNIRPGKSKRAKLKGRRNR